jgi:hypothetical protein
MPRGVYDRSKSKEQRAAEKAAGKPSNPKSVKKYAKKGASLTKTGFISLPTLEENHKRLEAMEQYFAILTAAKAGGALNTKIEKAINSTIDRMESLAERIWPLNSEDTGEAHEAVAGKKNGAHSHAASPAPTTQTAPPAPVPFNPATPPQS